MNKKILVVSPYFPYPANFGGAVDIFKRIQMLKSCDSLITLVAIYRAEPSEDDIQTILQYVDNLILLKRKKAIPSILSVLPFQVSSRTKLRKYIFKEEYDTLIIEGDYVASILKNKTLKAKKKILRMHNDESKFHAELCKASFPLITSLYYFVESLKFLFYKKRIYNKVDRIACISKDECDDLKKNAYTHAYFVPSSVDFDLMKKRDRGIRGKTVLYIGALFMPNNIEGIVWYINNVHKQLVKKYPNYRFIIVGSTHGAKDENKVLQLCNNDSQIEIYFNAPDLEEYYAQSTLFINPMLNGAGVKIKSLNSIIEGLPLVTTTKGIEGTGLEHRKHVLIGDRTEDFLRNIELLFEHEELSHTLVDNAQNYLRENYSKDNIIQAFFPS